MRRTIYIAILLALASSLFAQRGGGVARGGVSRGAGFRSGPSHSNYRSGFRGGYSGTGFVGYNSPLYYGGFGYSTPWLNNFNYDPPVSYVSPVYYEAAAAPPAPAVVINEYYRPAAAQPRMRDYSNGGYGVEPPAPAPPATEGSAPPKKPENWLIAFPNGTIVLAVTYWTDGTTLHYVTRNKEPKQLPISGIDRELTQQLNQERGLEFRIPK